MDSKAYPENAPPTNTYQQPPGSSGNMATPNMYGQPPPYEQACYPSPNQPYPYPPRQGNIEIDDIFIIEDRFAKKICGNWLKTFAINISSAVFSVFYYML